VVVGRASTRWRRARRGCRGETSTCLTYSTRPTTDSGLVTTHPRHLGLGPLQISTPVISVSAPVYIADHLSTSRLTCAVRNLTISTMGGDYRGTGETRPPPTIDTFSKQKLDFFPFLTTILVYCIFPYTVPQNIYSISFSRRMRGICNTCIRRGSGASG